jgi:hypothetical protein
MNYNDLYKHYTVEEKAKLCDQMLEKLGMMHELYSERRTDVCEFITYIADPDTHRPKAEARFIEARFWLDDDTRISVEYDTLGTEMRWKKMGNDEDDYEIADEHFYDNDINTPSTFEELMRREK